MQTGIQRQQQDPTTLADRIEAVRAAEVWAALVGRRRAPLGDRIGWPEVERLLVAQQTKEVIR